MRDYSRRCIMRDASFHKGKGRRTLRDVGGFVLVLGEPGGSEVWRGRGGLGGSCGRVSYGSGICTGEAFGISGGETKSAGKVMSTTKPHAA